MIFADNIIQDDPILRGSAYPFLPTTRLESMGASFRQLFAENPAVAGGDALLMRARTGFDTDGLFDAPAMDRGFAGPGAPELRGGGTNLSESALAQEMQIDPVLSMEVANSLAAPGLTFDGPVRTSIFEAMNANRLAEIKREDIINRGPGDALQFGLNIGAGLAASLFDPLNIASAFVPVVGEARSAILIRNLGKVGGRTVKGAIEGAAGAVMVEPIAYFGSRGRGLDYDMTDSLLNVAFGTVLGGGLHVATGALGDALARADARTREALLRTAVAQIVDGRPIDIRPVLAAVPETPLRRGLLSGTTLGRAGDDGLDAAMARESLPGTGTPAERASPGAIARQEPSLVPVLRDDGTPMVFQNRAQAVARADKLSKDGTAARTVELADGRHAVVRERPLARAGTRDISFRTRRAAERFIRQTGRQGDTIVRTGPDRYTLVRGADADDAKAMAALPEAVRIAPRSERVERPVSRPDQRAIVDAARATARDNFAARVDEPTRQEVVEADALFEEATTPAAPERVSAEADELAAEIDDMVSDGTLGDEAKAQIAEADKLIDDVKRYNKGLRAAAQCLIGRG